MSDQGTQYTSRELANLLEKYAIKAIFTTPYNPQGNGISERLNQILAEINRNQENMSRIVNYAFNIGDIVFKRKLIRGKTDPLWTGPFTIKKVNNNTVLIQDDHREIWTNLRQITLSKPPKNVVSWKYTTKFN